MCPLLTDELAVHTMWSRPCQRMNCQCLTRDLDLAHQQIHPRVQLQTFQVARVPLHSRTGTFSCVRVLYVNTLLNMTQKLAPPCEGCKMKLQKVNIMAITIQTNIMWMVIAIMFTLYNFIL